MKELDFTKLIKTRDGRDVRILCTDAQLYDGRTIVAVINGSIAMLFPDGQGYPRSMVPRIELPYDLVNVPEKRKVWLNLYELGSAFCYPSKDIADEQAGKDRIACVEVEYTEGEGLDHE